jgi:ElaB/YqjD/DUF883 family membrane-anchored ribosome-binding protein
MASTTETAAEVSANGRAARSKATEDELQKQIDQLHDDIKSLAGTLSRLGKDKVGEAEGLARKEYRHLVRAGQDMVSDVGDEFGQMEKQLKDTIRERPLTAVLGAVGLGFVLALLTR